MIFIKELIHPALKCERIGHKMVDRKATIRKEGGDYPRDICTDYVCDIPTCSRCYHRDEPKNLVRKESYNGVSMPTSWWDRMRENGYLIL